MKITTFVLNRYVLIFININDIKSGINIEMLSFICLKFDVINTNVSVSISHRSHVTTRINAKRI